MQPIASKLDDGNDIRSWIEDLTDYTPQKVQQVLQDIKQPQNTLVSAHIRTYFLFAEKMDGF